MIDTREHLVVSFSGGKTSAYMSCWLLENYSHLYVFHFVFANTGREHEETLIFVDRCDKHFGLNLTWVEAVFDSRRGVGVRHRVVDFESASRNGEPFEAFIAKEGIPNVSRAHCTSRLKTRAIRHWMKTCGLIKRGWQAKTAIGMRADEPRRANQDSASAKEFNLVYPLAHWHEVGITKRDVNNFWGKMPFNLNIPEHYGNCITCFKKSDNKLSLIAHEHMDWFKWNAEMEVKYKHINAAKGDEHRWWRKKRTTDQLITGALLREHETLIMLTTQEPDDPNGCGNECQPFAKEDNEVSITKTKDGAMFEYQNRDFYMVNKCLVEITGGGPVTIGRYSSVEKASKEIIKHCEGATS